MIIIEENDTRFYSDHSTLPGAGLGCFAKELIKKGDYLEVIGVMVKKGGVADKCTHYAMRYKFAGSKLDTKIIPLGFAGLVNHTDDKLLQNVEIRNVRGLQKRSLDASEIVYMAIRDILPGEEVLGNYGEIIDIEIKKIAENQRFYDKNRLDWEKFVSYNLYGLAEL